MASTNVESSDSPLSYIGNIISILTFVVAVGASTFVYLDLARSATHEVQSSLEELQIWEGEIDHLRMPDRGDTIAQRRLAKISTGAVEIVFEVRMMLRGIAYGHLLSPFSPRRYLKLLRWLRYRDDIREKMEKLRIWKSDALFEEVGQLSTQMHTSSKKLGQIQATCAQTNVLVKSVVELQKHATQATPTSPKPADGSNLPRRKSA